MSSTANIQNLLVNVFRPVYTYDSTTGLFTTSLQLTNVSYSGNTLSASNLAVGDANQNVYVGSNAGNSYSNLQACVGNTTLGYNAGGLVSNVANGVYIGYNAGASASNASNVIAIGSNAGGNGNTNIFVGANTGSTGSNNILIGHNISGGSSNNLLRIGRNIYGNLANQWVGIGTDISTSGNNFDVSGNTRISGSTVITGTLTAGAFDVSAVASTNLVVPGYIRNALTPTQFDISGGNISNSAVHTTTGLVGTYLRNALTPTTYDISGGNISNSGTTTSTNALVSGYLRNALTPSQFDISGGNISNSATITTSNVRAANGTVAAPTYAFTSDASLGVYRVAANQLGFASAGVQRMTISNSNVGIGTSTPSNFIHIQKASWSFPSTDTDGTTFGINFGSSNYTDQAKILAVDRNVSTLWCGELAFYTSYNGGSSTEKVRFNTDGRVGIGTSVPLSVLDISASGATVRIADQRTTGIPSLEFIRGTSTTYGGDANTDWRIRNSNGSLFFNRADNTGTAANNGDFGVMTFDGRMGIGTTAPQYALDVSGGASGTSGARVSSTFFVTTNQDTTSPGFRLRPSADIQYFQWGPNVSSGVSDASGVKLIFTGINASGSYVTIDQATHNVGIGTTAPLSILDISDVGATVRIADQRSVGIPSLEFIRGASTTYGGDANTDWRIRNAVGGNLTFNRADNTGVAAQNGDFVTMTYDGKMGIGAVAPVATLDVSSSAAAALIQNGGLFLRGRPSWGQMFVYNSTAQNAIVFEDACSNIVRAVDNFPSTGPTGWQVGTNSNVQGGSGFAFTRVNSGGASTSNIISILSSGNVGIGTTTPSALLDVTQGGTGVQASTMLFAGNGGSGTASNLATSIYKIKGAGGGDVSGAIQFSLLGAGTYGFTVLDSNSQPYVRFDGTNDRLGVGTTAPAYALDVSAGTTTASVNMSTWPRTTASTCFCGTGTTRSGDSIIYTTNTSMDTNLITVASNTGTYFTINKPGIYAITAITNGTTTGNYNASIDASTNIGHNAAFTTPSLAALTGFNGQGWWTLNYTGYLPSNSGMYYKVKVSGAMGLTTSRLTIAYLGETTAFSGWFI
jgi:hypothetical protein